MKYPFQLTASLICADKLHLAEDIAKLEEGKIDFLHFDVMDGAFVPRFGMFPEQLQAIRSLTKLPIDVHMMTNDPEPYVAQLAQAGANIIVVHAEACIHLHRVIGAIKACGVKAGVALNPATSLSALDYVMDDIDLIELMAINPGIVGHQLIPHAIAKIAQTKKLIKKRRIIIEIDGGVTPESAPKMIKAGANLLVCGTSSIFKIDAPIDVMVPKFRQGVQRALGKKRRA